MGVRRMVVRTTVTAEVTEEWIFEVPEGVDINTYCWNGAGWGDALEAGHVELVQREEIDQADRREVAVLSVTEVPVARAS